MDFNHCAAIVRGTRVGICMAFFLIVLLHHQHRFVQHSRRHPSRYCISLSFLVCLLAFSDSCRSADEFITTATADKQEKRHELMHGTEMALDPLLGSLASFSTPQDLERSIFALFEILDVRDKGSISYEDLHHGLTLLNSGISMSISVDDWDVITEEGSLCLDDGSLNFDRFDMLMRRQLSIYILRNAAFCMGNAEPAQACALGVLKLVLLILGTGDMQGPISGPIPAGRAEKYDSPALPQGNAALDSSPRGSVQFNSSSQSIVEIDRKMDELIQEVRNVIAVKCLDNYSVPNKRADPSAVKSVLCSSKQNHLSEENGVGFLYSSPPKTLMPTGERDMHIESVIDQAEEEVWHY